MYKDRGIIKWHPFDALNGFSDEIKKLKYERGKTEIPLLLEDKFEELDLTLKEAFKFNLEIEIKYFVDGYIKNIFGQIKEIDVLNKKIILNNNFEVMLQVITDLIAY